MPSLTIAKKANKSRSSARPSKRHYDELLREFVKVCEGWVRRGQPYLAVILSHELFRFLYPFEPVLNLKLEDPVPFVTSRLKNLVELGKSFASIVLPYPLDWSGWKNGPVEEASLERKTSDLYSSLWRDFKEETLWEEGVKLIQGRLSGEIINKDIRGKEILDMGCGSGRYAIALARLGAKRVVAIDYERRSYARAEELATSRVLPVEFYAGDLLSLPFEDDSFDFVFCNGVLHHTRSIQKGLEELARVLRPSGKAFLYLYATGGIFWQTRRAIRQIFKKIPKEYTLTCLQILGLPPNRFIFSDTWYVPRETHTSRRQLERMLKALGFSYQKVLSKNLFDLDWAVESGEISGAREMWGEGEHRYLLKKG